MALHNDLAGILPLGFNAMNFRFASTVVSPAASTTEQVRQDYQLSSSVDGLLKQVYIPALNNTTFHATPLMEMFGDFGGVIDFAGNKIIKAFKHQGAGGFGGISEGGAFVKGRRQKGFQGYERIKFLNAFFSLTGPASKTIRTGVGSYVDAVSDAMDDTLMLARQQMERIIGGSGDGELCRFTNGATDEAAIANGEYFMAIAGASSTTPTAAKNTVTGLAAAGAYSVVQWLQPGLRVQLVLTSELDGTVPKTDIYGAFTVEQVDYTAGTFRLKYTPVTSTDTLNISDLASAAVSLTLEGAYGEVEAAGTVTVDQCLELNGLYNLVSDGVDYSGTNGADESVDKYAKIWNFTRSSQPHALKSIVKDAGQAELDEELLIDWVLDLVNLKQSIPNVLVTDPKSRLKYFGNRKEDRRFDMKVMDSQFGFRSIGVVIDQYSLILQSLSSLRPGTLFLLNTNGFKFAKATQGFQWIQDGGQILRNFEEKDGMFGTAINYCEFVCEDPKGQLKAFDLAYT